MSIVKKVIIFLVLVKCIFTAANLTVDPSTGHFIDQYGRVRIYHGVNVVYKVDPYYPPVLNFFTPETSFSK